jgi:hypothetical protein
MQITLKEERPGRDYLPGLSMYKVICKAGVDSKDRIGPPGGIGPICSDASHEFERYIAAQ